MSETPRTDCKKCGTHYHLPDGYDHTPYCAACAHVVVEQLERELAKLREKITCIEMDRDHARLDAKTERERADRNQEDALTLMRALINVRQQMFPQHDQRAVVSRDFPKLAAIDAQRRK